MMNAGASETMALNEPIALVCAISSVYVYQQL
jgi:hypothetical protein